jgi:hypothetical protein
VRPIRKLGLLVCISIGYLWSPVGPQVAGVTVLADPPPYCFEVCEGQTYCGGICRGDDGNLTNCGEYNNPGSCPCTPHWVEQSRQDVSSYLKTWWLYAELWRDQIITQIDVECDAGTRQVCDTYLYGRCYGSAADNDCCINYGLYGYCQQGSSICP